MRSWWKKKYGKDHVCAITNTRLRPGKNKHDLRHAIFLPCKHGFCRSSLVYWVLTKPSDIPTCPLCRCAFDPLIVFTAH